MFNRRGILGMFAAAPVAAPAAIKAAQADIAARVPKYAVAQANMATNLWGDAQDCVAVEESKESRIARIIEKYHKMKARDVEITLRHVEQIDPDIAELKSFSKAAKIQMQRQRLREIYKRNELNDILRELFYTQGNYHDDIFDAAEIARKYGLL